MASIHLARSGKPSTVDGKSRASTQESTARSSRPHMSEQERDVAYKTISDASMATTSSNHSVSHDIELDYNTRIRCHKENTYGAKIYKDFKNRFVVKIKDHRSAFDRAPVVNYQGNYYMGRDGVMYLVIDNPDVVDTLGGIVQRELHWEDEGPPIPIQPGIRMINYVWTRRVLIDDVNGALYKRNDSETEFYHL